MQKAPDAFRTISEVADDLDVPQHVLRFWETRFTQIKPMKRSGGRRYYRPEDVALLRGIRHLLYGEGYTIRGVQRILREQGAKSLQRLAGIPMADSSRAIEDALEDIDLVETDGDGDLEETEDAPAAPRTARIDIAPQMSSRPVSRETSSVPREPAMRAHALSEGDRKRLLAALDDLNACRAMLDEAIKTDPA